MRRVLVVDDNADLRESLGTLVTLLGHEVRCASGGEQGLRELETLRPDLALIDVSMPGVSGYEVARRAREADWGRAVQLVAMTGWDRPEDRARAMDAGFDLFLIKPMGIDQLRALLAGPIAGRPMSRDGDPG